MLYHEYINEIHDSMEPWTGKSLEEKKKEWIQFMETLDFDKEDLPFKTEQIQVSNMEKRSVVETKEPTEEEKSLLKLFEGIKL